jgi:hypothetical protein
MSLKMIQYDGDYSVESMSRLSGVIKVKENSVSSVVRCVKSKLISFLSYIPQFEFIIQSEYDEATSYKILYGMMMEDEMEIIQIRFFSFTPSYSHISTFYIISSLISVSSECELFTIRSSLFPFDHKLDENVGN